MRKWLRWQWLDMRRAFRQLVRLGMNEEHQ